MREYFMESVIDSTGDLRVIDMDPYMLEWFDKYPRDVEVVNKKEILSRQDAYMDEGAIDEFEEAIDSAKVIIYYSPKVKDLRSKIGRYPQTVLGVYEIIS